jgi:flagellar protein FlaJ
MRKIPNKIRKITAAVSIVSVVVAIIALAVLRPSMLLTYLNEIMLAAVLAIVVPSAILDYENQKWVEGIEDQMPLLVRGVAESQETGLTLIKAFDKVVDDKLVSNPLSAEVKRITIQMAWGTSFEDALINFKKRVNSPIVDRFCALVLEASRSGGTIKKVFTSTSGFMQEMKEIDKETSSQMKPYIVIIYAAFAVFLITAVLLVQSFFTPVTGAPQIMGQGTIGGVTGLKDFFYQNMLVSAITGGIVAGKLGERRILGGLKHAIVLSMAGYVMFFLVIPPNWM